MMRVFFLLVFLVIFTANSANCSDSLFQKGVSEISLGNYKQARNNFLSDVERNPSFASFYNLGIASGNLENWSEARWAFESALKYKPSSNKAQFNANFALQQIDKSLEWTHPYPWTDRLVLSFGYYFWLILALFSSILIGGYAFLFISKNKRAVNSFKWLNRMLVVAIVLLLVSFYGLYHVNKHYNTYSYVIIKTDSTPFFISPNGVELDVSIPKGSRLDIEKVSDNDWLLLHVPDRNRLWVKADKVLAY